MNLKRWIIGPPTRTLSRRGDALLDVVVLTLPIAALRVVEHYSLGPSEHIGRRDIKTFASVAAVSATCSQPGLLGAVISTAAFPTVVWVSDGNLAAWGEGAMALPGFGLLLWVLMRGFNRIVGRIHTG